MKVETKSILLFFSKTKTFEIEILKTKMGHKGEIDRIGLSHGEVV